MKKEINQKDIDKILTLKTMTENICKLCEEENKYVQHLFKHFQEDKYYSINFFVSGTSESNFYNYLDYLDREFNKFYASFFKMIGSLDYYLLQFESEKKLKKEDKNNENN